MKQANNFNNSGDQIKKYKWISLSKKVFVCWRRIYTKVRIHLRQFEDIIICIFVWFHGLNQEKCVLFSFSFVKYVCMHILCWINYVRNVLISSSYSDTEPFDSVVVHKFLFFYNPHQNFGSVSQCPFYFIEILFNIHHQPLV